MIDNERKNDEQVLLVAYCVCILYSFQVRLRTESRFDIVKPIDLTNSPKVSSKLSTLRNFIWNNVLSLDYLLRNFG